MNLEQSDSFKDEVEKNSRHRKGVMLSIVLCGMMIALLFILIMFLSYQDSITEKLFIDDTQVTLSSDFYKKVDGVVYINVKQFAELLKYNYFNGEYGQYNENPDSCYIQNDFEIVALTANNKYFDKYLQLEVENLTIADIPVTLKNENGYKEKFETEHEIQFINDQLYVPLESMIDMFNVNYSWTPYRYKFITFETALKNAQKKVASFQYKEMSGYYENLKTVLYNYVIVGNGEATVDQTKDKNSTSKYGIISLEDGSEIAGVKYNDIRFVQNAKEFYVTVTDGSMGIIDATGKIIINAKEYQNISLLDDDNQLYLVQKDLEYGVINRLGKTIIYAENDAIGLDVSPYRVNTIENPSVLFGKCIPVEKDEKFGLYDTNGECVLNMVYDGFGYSVNKEDTKASGSELNVLLIPSEVGINGIVINMNDLYGIYDVNTQKIVLPCVASKIYAITKNGLTNYYYEFNNEQIDIAQWLLASGLNNIKQDKNNLTEEDDNNTNTVSNTVSTNTTASNTEVVNETVENTNNEEIVENQ